jgi:putative copper export protein
VTPARPLGRAARSLLLAAHVLAAAVWIGGVCALVLVSRVSRGAANGEALALARSALGVVDRALIVPACLASLATGFLCSWRTPWGFFQHGWVTAKWAITVSMIVFGAVALGPWVDETAARAASAGLGALGDAGFSRRAALVEGFGVGQLALLVVMLLLSTFKPSGKKRAR